MTKIVKHILTDRETTLLQVNLCTDSNNIGFLHCGFDKEGNVAVWLEEFADSEDEPNHWTIKIWLKSESSEVPEDSAAAKDPYWDSFEVTHVGTIVTNDGPVFVFAEGWVTEVGDDKGKNVSDESLDERDRP